MTTGAGHRIHAPQTIDEVVEHLDALIDWARREHSRVGYFAAMYRGVTLRVHAGIIAGLCWLVPMRYVVKREFPLFNVACTLFLNVDVWPVSGRTREERRERG